MGEFLTKAIPRILLVSALGVAGCGGPLRGRAMPDLDCGANPENANTTTFGNMRTGDTIVVGHTFINDNGGLEADAVITLNPEGELVGTTHKRGSSNGATPEIQGGPNGGLEITAGDEQFNAHVTGQSGDLYTVTVDGRCVATP